MSRTTIRMPALGAEASTARVVTWLRGVGNSVARDADSSHVAMHDLYVDGGESLGL